MKADETRRAFIGKAAVAAPAVLLGASAMSAEGSSGGGRRAIEARPGAPFSRAVILDKVVFVAGVVGRPEGSDEIKPDFETQCRQAMENLKASVEASGSDMTQVLKCGCFLTDMADFPTMNRLFREYFPSSPPARSTVVVKELVVPGAKIEIDCVTALA